MSDIAIRVEKLSKKYRIGAKQEGYRTLRDTLTGAFVSPFHRARRLLGGQPYGASELDETIWALKDISFEIKRGEVVGIIGRNGAGKTTLLKVLSRITEPTEGQAEIYGRVGSLLEVGTGFHPELTGRENIYLNGAILGMKKAEIAQKFDEIVAFAEIEKFIDTPVKHYSSGMYVRLAFAVAAHLEPEILLVDEVLAVGDAAFQRKCLGKMGDVAKEGRTVLFVSHNMTAIQSLCERAICLDQGEITADGEPGEVVSNYLKSYGGISGLKERLWQNIKTAPGNDMVRLRRVCIKPDKGLPSDIIYMHTPIVMAFEFWNLISDIYLDINFHVFNQEGILTFADGALIHKYIEGSELLPTGLYRTKCYIPGDLLNAGAYHVKVFFGKDNKYIVYSYENIISFDVEDSLDRYEASYCRIPGVIRPLLRWHATMLDKNGDFSV